MKCISLIGAIAFAFLFSNQDIVSIENNKFKTHMHFGVFVNEDPKISFPIIIKKEDYSSFGRLFPNRRGTMILPSIGCELYEGRSNAFLVELFIHPILILIICIIGHCTIKQDNLLILIRLALI